MSDARLFLVFVLVLALAGASAGAGDLGAPLHDAVVRVRLTQLLVDAQGGIHPLEEPILGQVALELQGDGAGGGWNGSIDLGGEGRARIDYFVRHKPTRGGAHHVTLERTLVRGGKEEKLPPLEHDLHPLSSWAPTLVEEPGKGRVVLLVTPEIQQATQDVVLESARIVMWVRRGIMIELPTLEPGGAPGAEPKILYPAAIRFMNVNGWGRGLQMGLVGIGMAKVAVEPFPGAERCGWVRGHTMEFELGGRKFRTMSDTLILPDDPTRPGKGWTLFGKLEPDPQQKQAVYGPFEPERER